MSTPLRWANFLHIYQPPGWEPKTIRKVARESYCPLIAFLKKNKTVHVTLNINASLSEQLHRLGYASLLRDIRRLAERNQIELTGSAAYHPLLPLLPMSEIIRQIRLNEKINRTYFGSAYSPRGFFPPEMAYSKKVALCAKKAKYKWLLIDEIAYNGTIGALPFRQVHTIKDVGIGVLFRNRVMSNYISFHSQLQRPDAFWRAVADDGRSHSYLLTAMDGENLGHHRPGLDTFWQTLVQIQKIKTCVLSALFSEVPSGRALAPRQSSWSSREKELRRRVPFALWRDQNNPIHTLQWRLVHRVISLVASAEKHPDYKHVRLLLDKHLASDQFWWASAKPWWSLAIITKKAKELAALAALVEKNGVSQRLAVQIIKKANSWQQNRSYQTTASAYLRHDDDAVRIMGGKKIK